MAVVRLRPPLRELAGGQREVELAGQTVGDVLRRLETEHPKLAGWVLDDQGKVRRARRSVPRRGASRRGRRRLRCGPSRDHRGRVGWLGRHRGAGRHEEGAVRSPRTKRRADGRRGARLPRQLRRVCDPRPTNRPVLRERHTRSVRPASLRDRRPDRRVGTDRRTSVLRGRGCDRRADLGDHAGRGGRPGLRGRRPGGPVREP